MGIHGNFIVGLSVDVLISSKNPEHKELYLLGEEIVTELGHVKITSDFYEKGAIMQNQEDDAEDDTEDDGKNDGEDDNPWFLIFADHEEGSSPDKYRVSVATDFWFQKVMTWSQLERGFHVIFEKFNTEISKDCLTSIRVQPAAETWRFEQIKGIAKSILYYESRIDSILPERRSGIMKCERNGNSHKLRGKPLHEVFEILDDVKQVDTIDKVARLMCAYEGKEVDETTQCTFSWNFAGLEEGHGPPRSQFIEFLQPPGSTSFDDAELWIGLIVAFIEAAILEGNEIDPKNGPNTEMLKRFLRKGADSARVPEKMTQALGDLFEGKC